jgi:hypothetical protein
MLAIHVGRKMNKTKTTAGGGKVKKRSIIETEK